MPLVRDPGPPSTLATVIGQVKDALGAMGDPTLVQVGKRYIKDGHGFAPRVVFLAEPRGSVGEPENMGAVAAVAHSCRVFVQAREGRPLQRGDEDIVALDEAYRLMDRVLGLIRVAAPGRITWGDFGDATPLDVTDLGVFLTFGFMYRRDVRHDPERMALPPADPDTSPIEPLIPPGTQGEVDGVTLEVSPKETN